MGDEVRLGDVTVRVETTLCLGREDEKASIARPDKLLIRGVPLDDPAERRLLIDEAVADFVKSELVQYSWEEIES